MSSNDTIFKTKIEICYAFYGIFRLKSAVSMIIYYELIKPQSCCKEVDKKIFRTDIDEIVLKTLDTVYFSVSIFACT